MKIVLRPAGPSDEGFLFALFVSSRDNDLAIVPEPQRTALMRMQFNGQSQTYTQRYPASAHNILSVDGVDVGRLWVAETEEVLAILDIAILPEYRNRGIGGNVYRDLIDRGEASRKNLRATVSTANPASLRFHEKMGFQRVAADGLYIVLVRSSTS